MLTKAQIEEDVTYDPETGEFRWNRPAGIGGHIPVGTIAGRCNAEGYRYLHLRGRDYRATRVAWLLVTGEWPKDQIDHRNGDTSDDRFENLRECTQSENKSNSKRYKNNKTGYKGVTYDDSKSQARYRATVTKDGKVHHLGWYMTAEEAHAARVKRLARFHGDFARQE
jgi:hypothetical protein